MWDEGKNAECSGSTRSSTGPLAQQGQRELVQGVQQQCGGLNARRPMTVTGSPACKVPERDNEDGVQGCIQCRSKCCACVLLDSWCNKRYRHGGGVAGEGQFSAEPLRVGFLPPHLQSIAMRKSALLLVSLRIILGSAPPAAVSAGQARTSTRDIRILKLRSLGPDSAQWYSLIWCIPLYLPLFELSMHYLYDLIRAGTLSSPYIYGTATSMHIISLQRVDAHHSDWTPDCLFSAPRTPVQPTYPARIFNARFERFAGYSHCAKTPKMLVPNVVLDFDFATHAVILTLCSMLP
ncbi:hypothetical protein B0H13DRAFT_1907477 [Mycena leptocephala]|nr:hypothetical protein B0H13DRAFT_1907477 [Mycena leptocephala]